MIYTGIGSRETPEHVLWLMEHWALNFAASGLTLRSGRAPGADQAFERGAATGMGERCIYLPWPGFEEDVDMPDTEGLTIYSEPTAEAYIVASNYHPGWGHLKYAARKFHARNSHQVLGWALDEPSDFIVCWTKNGKRGGGTGQALRIAEDYQIPIFDLGKGDDKDSVKMLREIFERINWWCR